jgi:hypothetical protein
LIHIAAQPDHGADPAHPHVDGNQSANVKFADDGNAPSGALPSDPSTLTALPSDPSGAHGPAARALAPDDDTPGQSAPADNGHHWGADPDIKLASIPENHSPEQPADHSPHMQHDDDGSPAATDGVHPGRGQGDRGESASPKFDDDGGNHSAHATGEGSPPADHGHHANADAEINPPQHPAGNSLHAHAQHDDNDSPAATAGAHPVHGQADRSDSASPKFADDGDAHPGKVSHEPPALTALSNDVSEDDSAHGAHTAHGQADRSEAAGPKFADDGSNNSGKAPHDPSALTALSNDVSADDSAHGAHTAHGQADRSESAGPKFADDGSNNSGKAPHDPPALTALPSDVSGDDSAKTNLGHHASADPKINDIANDHPSQNPADNSLHAPAQPDDNGSPAVTDGAHPGRGQVDGIESASAKAADDGSNNSGKAPHDPSALTALPSDVSGDDPAKTNLDHHASADPKNNDIAKDLPPQQPADDSLHTPAQDDGASAAATDGAHPGRGQGDGGEPASPNFADNGNAQSAHATGEDTSVPSALASNGHHGNADPEINDIAKNNDIAKDLSPQQPADDSLHTPAQDDGASAAATDGAHPGRGQVDGGESASPNFADNGSDHGMGPDGAHKADPQVDLNQLKFADDGSGHGTGPDGAHPAHPQVDGNQSDSFKFADGGDHPGTITNDPTAVTASSDSSGTHGPAAPTLANTLGAPDAGVSAAPDQFVFAENAGHGAGADHKTDMTEIDHPVPAEIQQVLDTAHETNAVSPPDPSHGNALPDTVNVQAPYHPDVFHFV